MQAAKASHLGFPYTVSSMTKQRSTAATGITRVSKGKQAGLYRVWARHWDRKYVVKMCETLDEAEAVEARYRKGSGIR